MFRFSWRGIRAVVLMAFVITIASFIPPIKNSVISVLSPLVVFIRHRSESVISTVTTVRTLATLPKENGELRAKLNEQTALEIKNKELLHENDLLRKELSLSTSSSAADLMAAQVISRTASVSQQSLLINKGTRDGFTKDMAVVAQGYLIGQVEEALETSSRVSLITSPNSLVPVVLQDSRSVGLLKGGTSGLIIDEIPRDVTIQEKEALVTANLGDVIKSGIPIGSVKAVISGSSDVFQSASVVSPIDFSRLEVVFGVKDV